MKTKAELEAEIAELQLEVAGLRAAVEAYQFAFQYMNKQTYYPASNTPWADPSHVWPNTFFPVTTWNSNQS